jgi:hypothetical protein
MSDSGHTIRVPPRYAKHRDEYIRGYMRGYIKGHEKHQAKREADRARAAHKVSHAQADYRQRETRLTKRLRTGVDE